MEPGPTTVARSAIAEFRCGRIQRTTGRRCSKLLRRSLLTPDGFEWLGHMWVTTGGAEPPPDGFHTMTHSMKAAVPIEKTMDGIDRWTFECHRRCGNRPTITLARAKDEATHALASGENVAYI